HYTLNGSHAVTWTDVAEQLPVVAGVKAVHARQAPTCATQPAECHGEHGVANLCTETRAGSVANVAIKRVQVTNAIAPVAQGVGRSVLKVRTFRTQLQADHAAGCSNGFVGNAAFCRGIANGRLDFFNLSCSHFSFSWSFLKSIMHNAFFLRARQGA